MTDNKELRNRPFDPKVLALAKRIVRNYRVVTEPHPEMGFIGHTIELPNVYGDGKTEDECVKDTIEATVGAVATMIEMETDNER